MGGRAGPSSHVVVGARFYPSTGWEGGGIPHS